MTWTELRREIFIQAQNWRSALCTGTFSLASSSKGATSVDSVDLSFNYKTQTLDQLVDSNKGTHKMESILEKSGSIRCKLFKVILR